MQDVPLIEQAGSASSGSDGTAQVTRTSSAPADGPHISFTRSDGSQVVLDSDDLMVYLVTLQTLLLLYVTYLEVRGR
ncbi:hypothetical protein [Haloarchaeobius sp. DT45]|uniref:hypothetical protein n=1 Tax=Haloarchaeobius sp. DT45 TaxID=3446116 RepID=UPI003F6CAF06